MTGRPDRATLERVLTALAAQAGSALRAVHPQAGGGAPLPARQVTLLANVKRAPVCAACGTVNPPPDRSCDLGIVMLDHYVGTADGCPGCGRLPAACRREPCSAMAGIW